MDRDDSFGHDFRLADRGRARIAGDVGVSSPAASPRTTTSVPFVPDGNETRFAGAAVQETSSEGKFVGAMERRKRAVRPVTIPLGLTERPPTVSVVTGSWRMSTAQTFIVTFVVASFVTEPESS